MDMKNQRRVGDISAVCQRCPYDGELLQEDDNGLVMCLGCSATWEDHGRNRLRVVGMNHPARALLLA